LKIVVGLIIIILCFASMMIVIPNIFYPKPSMVVEKFSEVPDEYFVMTEADPVLSKAISKMEKSESGRVTMSFNSLDETEVDELIIQHKTGNIKYQANYYFVGILIGTPSMVYSQITAFSFIGLTISVIILVSVIILKILKIKKKDSVKSLL
jgi:hypothetical protein